MWVARQRKINNKNDLSPARYELLEAIQFDWGTGLRFPSHLDWNAMYARLELFHAVHHHTNVPQLYEPDPKLGTWVMLQRNMNRNNNSNLTPERHELLSKLGFEWNRKGKKQKPTPLSSSPQSNTNNNTEQQNLPARAMPESTTTTMMMMHNTTMPSFPSQRTAAAVPAAAVALSAEEEEQQFLNDYDTATVQAAIQAAIDAGMPSTAASGSPRKTKAMQGDEELSLPPPLPGAGAAVSPRIMSLPPSTAIIDEPVRNDVLFGRGGRVNLHQGNKWYRSIVQTNRTNYHQAPKHTKKAIAEAIVLATKSRTPPGRFLKQYKKNSNHSSDDADLTTPVTDSSDLWIEVTTQQAVQKTSQALRERYMIDESTASPKGKQKSAASSNNNSPSSTKITKKKNPPPQQQQQLQQSGVVPQILSPQQQLQQQLILQQLQQQSGVPPSLSAQQRLQQQLFLQQQGLLPVLSPSHQHQLQQPTTAMMMEAYQMQLEMQAHQMHMQTQMQLQAAAIFQQQQQQQQYNHTMLAGVPPPPLPPAAAATADVSDAAAIIPPTVQVDNEDNTITKKKKSKKKKTKNDKETSQPSSSSSTQQDNNWYLQELLEESGNNVVDI